MTSFLTWIFYFFISFSEASDPSLPSVPEASSGRSASRPSVVSEKYMIVAANPYAASAGLEMLRLGGNAVDAAIAVQMVLNLVEPQSSGIGGGAFLLYYDATQKKLYAYDGREKAPMRADPRMFLDGEGKPKSFNDAVIGGLSVGVPGVVRMLEQVHAYHGKLPWAQLFMPAIRLCEAGFNISPRLHTLLGQNPALLKDPVAGRFYYDETGNVLPVGHLLKNLALSDTFKKIAEQGSKGLMMGEVAEDMVNAVGHHPTNPGVLTLEDLASYQPVVREPICKTYRTYNVCSFPPPTSGGIALLEMLGMLERFDLSKTKPLSQEVAHYMAEAERRAFLDRAQYVADSDFVDVPVSFLLSSSHMDDLLKTFRILDSLPPISPFSEKKSGRFWPIPAGYTFDFSLELPSTSHVSIVDAGGNAVSMTSSIENAFGSTIMVRGFFLNNQLTDFSFLPTVEEKPIANRVQPAKRPRSSMTPTIIFDSSGNLAGVLGSPGGSNIIGYVASAIIRLIDWRLDPQAATELPHIQNRGGPLELEKGTLAESLAIPMQTLGYEVKIQDMTSGLNIIWIQREEDKTKLLGGSDPRREGIALGD